MVDSRQKGSRAETVVKDMLKKHTKLGWERTPGSGALDEKHGLKGDLYIPNEKNRYCVEVKHYADDHFTTAVLSSKSPQILEWWTQTLRQGRQVSRNPLLIFKHDRSKIFVATEDFPTNEKLKYVFVNTPPYTFYVALLEDWLIHEQPEFTG